LAEGLWLISSPAFNFGCLYHLGNWIAEPNKCWDWHYDPGSGLLYWHLSKYWQENPSTFQANAINFSPALPSSSHCLLTYIVQLHGLTNTSEHTLVDLPQTTYLHRPTLTLYLPTT
jgi:hypothetical protein